MIESLRIRDLALVEEVALELGPGLHVLTGETGAGKSIVLGALALLAGARADGDGVREGASEAVVEAVFSTRALPDLELALAARGIDVEDHALVVRRSVSAAGRSRAWLGGQLVPAATLGEVFEGRMEISSQHESHALLRVESHGRILDAYGGLLGRREAVAQAWSALREIDAERARLRAAAEERARRLDFVSFQVREIDEAGVAPGERAGLVAERARLVHAERLALEAGGALALVAGGEGEDAGGARDRAGEAARRLDAAARLDASLGALADRLRAVAAELDDVGRELERYAAGLEADPARAAELEARLAVLERLQRKYGATEEEVLAFRERAARERDELAGADERLAALEPERERALERLRDAARALSEGRRAAAARLASALETALADLAMAGARFEIALAPVAAEGDLPCGPSGAEQPELRFSANPGEPARALRRVASGGELSRVFLALKNVLRGAAAGMVLVFDEVDAGIGGAVADRVGRALAQLATQHQVLCITHLPQIAARAATHLRVEKSVRDGRTRSEVLRLDGRSREEEIARMSGGERVGEETRRHARALLRAAGEDAARAAAERARPGNAGAGDAGKTGGRMPGTAASSRRARPPKSEA